MFSGPWFEDLWPNLCQSHTTNFGYFIPIFVPWIRISLFVLCRSLKHYFTKIGDTLSPDFLCVTVVQRHEGGIGYIPLLLWRKENESE
jgi:hypothetical protein